MVEHREMQWPVRQEARFGTAPPVAGTAAQEAKAHSDVEGLPEISSRPPPICSLLTIILVSISMYIDIYLFIYLSIYLLMYFSSFIHK